MDDITADGYGSSATLTADALTIRAKGRMGRMALFGADKRDQITIPLADIAKVKHQPPPRSALGAVNGHVDVYTADGTRYEMHYRAKKNAAFGDLARALVERVPA